MTSEGPGVVVYGKVQRNSVSFPVEAEVPDL